MVDRKSGRWLIVLLQFPLTWIAIAASIGFGLVFEFWFQPTALPRLIAWASAALAFLLWPVFFFSSSKFQVLLNKMPYEKLKVGELKADLRSCPDEFSEPVLECIELTNRIRREFEDHAYLAEIDSLLHNLQNLVDSYSQLYTRAQEFGTENQKRSMQAILHNQLLSVKKSLEALRTFSGNLTLLDANARYSSEIFDEIKAINYGLTQAIEEVSDDSI